MSIRNSVLTAIQVAIIVTTMVVQIPFIAVLLVSLAIGSAVEKSVEWLETFKKAN